MADNLVAFPGVAEAPLPATGETRGRQSGSAGLNPPGPSRADAAGSAPGNRLNLSRSFRNSSIRTKLLAVMALNSSLALLVAGLSMVGYGAFKYWNEASSELSTLADVIGASSTAALSFSDERAANETLSSLRGDLSIVSGSIYDSRNDLLASYRSPNGVTFPAPSRPGPDGVHFVDGDLNVFRPVTLQSERIGTIYLRKDLKDTFALLRRTVGVIILVLLASLGLALLLSSRIQRVISGPIGALAGVAHSISVDKNYSVRAPKTADDEIGVLIDSFNEMLGQIEAGERDRKIAEDALRESEERYALAAHGANDGLWDWKLLTNEIYFSPRWTSMLGYSDHENWTNPEEWFSRIHPADRERVRSQLKAHCLGATPEFSSEYRMRNRNGLYIWILTRGIAVRDKDGLAIRIAGSQTDITEGKVADALTELPNRIYLMDKLESVFAANGNSGAQPFAILFLDLDRFKVVNDSLGHSAGDQLLVGVSQRLISSVRGNSDSGRLTESASTVVRLGGDEFAILLEGIPHEDQAAIVAERVLKHLSAAFYIDGRQVFATSSIGIAMSGSADNPEDLLRNADTAMYYAKSRGKGRFEIFNQGMRERAVARIELEADLKKAIEEHQFVLHYQPKVTLDDKAITGFEALIRWNHPTRGLLYPSEFIPVAEETGLIVPIGLWVLREGCRQMAAWHKSMISKTPLAISINISFKQLVEPGIADELERILADTGLDPATLRLEITESSIMEDTVTTIATLRRFKKLKIGLEIDDFGTGNSSLSYLRQLPFDTVKIDQSFVKELGSADDTSEIISTILQLAKSLNMDVVAEGVETRDQLARLTAMGCSSGQGYLFSRPVEAERALQLIRDKEALEHGLLLRPGGMATPPESGRTGPVIGPVKTAA